MSLKKFIFNINDSSKLVLARGDLTRWNGDAIVNAAKQSLMGGGGVDGAIHRAAGPKLKQECERIKPVSDGTRCPTGEARITLAYNIPVKHIIHTVGPIYSGSDSAPFLEAAYRNSLELANEYRLKTIAFPAISCGIYGYPTKAAAEVSLSAIKASVGKLQEVHFLFFDTEALDHFVEHAQILFSKDPGALDGGNENNVSVESESGEYSEDMNKPAKAACARSMNTSTYSMTMQESMETDVTAVCDEMKKPEAEEMGGSNSFEEQKEQYFPAADADSSAGLNYNNIPAGFNPAVSPIKEQKIEKCSRTVKIDHLSHEICVDRSSQEALGTTSTSDTHVIEVNGGEHSPGFTTRTKVRMWSSFLCGILHIIRMRFGGKRAIN